MNTLIPIRPFNDFNNLDEFFGTLFGEHSRPSHTPQLTIPLDVIEDEGKITIKAAVPGINPDELEITIENNVLTIKGEHKTETVSETAKVFRRENTYGSFSRSLRLSAQLNQDAISATFKNGFVTITIPRVEEEKPKALRIPVQTEN